MHGTILPPPHESGAEPLTPERALKRIEEDPELTSGQRFWLRMYVEALVQEGRFGVFDEARASLNAEILEHAVTARRLRELEARQLEDVSTGDLLFALVQRAARKVMRWRESV